MIRTQLDGYVTLAYILFLLHGLFNVTVIWQSYYMQPVNLIEICQMTVSWWQLLYCGSKEEEK